MDAMPLDFVAHFVDGLFTAPALRAGRLTAPLLTTMATAVSELYLRCIHIRLPTRNLACGREGSFPKCSTLKIF